jgi:hypothetical protein
VKLVVHWAALLEPLLVVQLGDSMVATMGNKRADKKASKMERRWAERKLKKKAA